MNHERAAWVARHLGRDLTEAECALVTLVCAAFRVGPWNLQWGTRLRALGAIGARWSTTRDLASHDQSALTRLVFAAHDLGWRVSVGSAGLGGVEIMVHRRESLKHPSLQQALDIWRAQAWEQL